MRLKDLGENAFIKTIRERFPSNGIGDDTAVLDVPPGHSLLYCSDLVSENTHFIRDLHPPDSIGYKVIGVNVSDIGAMGGIPMFCTLSIALPGELDIQWLNSFIDGVARACAEFGVQLAGGDTSSADRIFADVSMVGLVESGQAVRRSGARPGDSIVVTGTLGGSALGLDRLRSGDLQKARRHLYPTPRHRIGRAVARQAHAMIDISDGLSTDLWHIIQESRVSARIYRDRIPGEPGATWEQVLHGGEEYELLIVAQDLPSEMDGIPLTKIGEIIPLSVDPQILLSDSSIDTVLRPGGYQHFSQ